MITVLKIYLPLKPKHITQMTPQENEYVSGHICLWLAEHLLINKTRLASSIQMQAPNFNNYLKARCFPMKHTYAILAILEKYGFESPLKTGVVAKEAPKTEEKETVESVGVYWKYHGQIKNLEYDPECEKFCKEVDLESNLSFVQKQKLKNAVQEKFRQG